MDVMIDDGVMVPYVLLVGSTGTMVWMMPVMTWLFAVFTPAFATQSQSAYCVPKRTRGTSRDPVSCKRTEFEDGTLFQSRNDLDSTLNGIFLSLK
jgi:hypothetical protein